MKFSPAYYIVGIIVLYLANLFYANWRLYKVGKFIKQTYPEQYQKTLQPGQWPNRPFPFNVRGMKHSSFGLLKAQAEKVGRVGNQTGNKSLIRFERTFYRNFQIRILLLFVLIIISYFA